MDGVLVIFVVIGGAIVELDVVAVAVVMLGGEGFEQILELMYMYPLSLWATHAVF